MNHTIDLNLEPIMLVGGGKHRKAGVKLARQHAMKVVAADGGADWLVKHDIMPDLVIGDFDSISAQTRRRIGGKRLVMVNEQDSTDFEKCLERIDAPLVLGVGFVGGRVDHQLASYHGLLQYPEKRCVLIGAEDITFLAPPQLQLDLPVGSLFSMFPMGKMRARSKGLKWQVDEVRFEPGHLIGTSNAVSGPVQISCDTAKMLITLPQEALGQVVKQLCAGGATWPARKRE